jgi:hypothetical protein
MHGLYPRVQLRAAFAVTVVPMRPDPMIVTVAATTAILRVNVFTFLLVGCSRPNYEHHYDGRPVGHHGGALLRTHQQIGRAT